MAPKNPLPINVKIESPIGKLLGSILRDYERMCSEFGCSPCPKIRETLRKGISEEILMKIFVMDPKDRRKVEYWEDKQFVEWFDNGCEDPRPRKKQRGKKKLDKTEKPLVRLLPFIDALRNHRYLQIKELYVWGVYVNHSDMLCLGSMVAKGNYELEYIELIDCFINEKALDAFAPFVNFTKTLTDLILDFNEFGDSGCYVLCEGLKSCHWLIRLSLCFCGLNKQSGIWLGNLVSETSIRELFVDGNHLEAEGAIALLTQLAEGATQEGFERERMKQEKLDAIEAERNAARTRVDLDAPMEDESAPVNQSNTNNPANRPDDGDVILYTDSDFSDGDDTNTNAAKKKKGRSRDKLAAPRKEKKKKRRSRIDRKGAKTKKPKMPPAGPQISHLHMAENSINSIGRGGSFAPVRCMQLLAAIITNAKDLQEVDLFGNDIGQVAGRVILEGILARKDNSLPKIGVRVTHLLNQDTYDMICKLAPKPKPKKKKKGARR